MLPLWNTTLSCGKGCVSIMKRVMHKWSASTYAHNCWTYSCKPCVVRKHIVLHVVHVLVISPKLYSFNFILSFGYSPSGAAFVCPASPFVPNRDLKDFAAFLTRVITFRSRRTWWACASAGPYAGFWKGGLLGDRTWKPHPLLMTKPISVRLKFYENAKQFQIKYITNLHFPFYVDVS